MKNLLTLTFVVTLMFACTQKNDSPGHAKQALYELILERFANERERFNYLMKNTVEIESELLKGAGKAKNIAQSVLQRVRQKVGY